ncbi:MAG: toxin-antitoxin system YwqK family antitoxin [Luteibaculaceae bacterium]
MLMRRNRSNTYYNSWFSTALVILFLCSFAACNPADKRFEEVKQVYKNGNKEIVWIYEVVGQDTLKIAEEEYFESGTKHMEIFFDREGKRTGVWRSWYPNGNLWSLHNYTDGKLHGEYKTWHKNGQIFISGRYEMDNQIGTWKYFSEDGTLEKQFIHNP